MSETVQMEWQPRQPGPGGRYSQADVEAAEHLLQNLNARQMANDRALFKAPFEARAILEAVQKNGTTESPIDISDTPEFRSQMQRVQDDTARMLADHAARIAYHDERNAARSHMPGESKPKRNGTY